MQRQKPGQGATPPPQMVRNSSDRGAVAQGINRGLTCCKGLHALLAAA